MDVAAWLHGLYLFTTIVGVGITAVDMLGILGAGEHDGDGAADGGHGGGEAADGQDGADHTSDAGDHGSILSILRYLRILIYFSLGFGPTGLVAEATGSSLLGSLAWALPGGVVAGLLARAFFRWQRQDIDSSVAENDLLLEPARVIVPLSHGDMGKVRVRLGQAVIERYALAEEEWESFRTDEVVEIVRVTDTCVYVRRAEAGLLDREP